MSKCVAILLIHVILIHHLYSNVIRLNMCVPFTL